MPHFSAENGVQEGREALNRRAVLLAVAVATATVLPAFLTGGLAVQVRGELDFGAAALGLAVAAFFVTSSLTSAPMGRVVERIGPHRGMRVGAIGGVAALLVVALRARSWAGFVACLVVGGLANAVSHPAASLSLAREVPAGAVVRDQAGRHSGGDPAGGRRRADPRRHRGLALGVRRRRRPRARRRVPRAGQRREGRRRRTGGDGREGRSSVSTLLAGPGDRTRLDGGDPAGRFSRGVFGNGGVSGGGPPPPASPPSRPPPPRARPGLAGLPPAERRGGAPPLPGRRRPG